MNILKVFQKQSQQLPPKIFNPDVPSGLIAETEKGFFYINKSLPPIITII